MILVLIGFVKGCLDVFGNINLDDENFFKVHLINSVPYFRYLIMGSVLLLIMRYRPKGILPEKVRHS